MVVRLFEKKATTSTFGIAFTYLRRTDEKAARQCIRINIRAEYEQIDLKDYRSSNALWLAAAWRF
jgi:hypothetical protein